MLLAQHSQIGISHLLTKFSHARYSIENGPEVRFLNGIGILLSGVGGMIKEGGHWEMESTFRVWDVLQEIRNCGNLQTQAR